MRSQEVSVPGDLTTPRLVCTGASYTTTYSVALYYVPTPDGLEPAPVHVHQVKGYSNHLYYYQLIDESVGYVIACMSGSANILYDHTSAAQYGVWLHEGSCSICTR